MSISTTECGETTSGPAPMQGAPENQAQPRSSAPCIADRLRSEWPFVAAAAAGFLVLFWPTFTRLARTWQDDPDFSHGFLIPLISAGILWANRRAIARLPAERCRVCFAVLLASLAVYALGYRTFTNTLERLGAWTALVAATGYAFGPAVLRRHAFPFGFLLLAIPPPFVLMSPIKLELKAVATRIAADALLVMGIPALPEGNVLALGELRLEVADACSGIRSLMAIVATALLLAYLFRVGRLKGLLLVVTAIPVTILVNIARIVVVATALVKLDINLSQGWRHDAVGFAVFAFSLGLLFAALRFYTWLLAWPVPKEAS